MRPLMVLSWGITTLIAVRAVKSFAGRPGVDVRSPSSSALNIARERYAGGEITKEQPDR